MSVRAQRETGLGGRLRSERKAASTAAGYWPRGVLSERLLLALTYVASEQGTYGLLSGRRCGKGEKSVAPVTETSVCERANALSDRASQQLILAHRVRSIDATLTRSARFASLMDRRGDADASVCRPGDDNARCMQLQRIVDRGHVRAMARPILRKRAWPSTDSYLFGFAEFAHHLVQIGQRGRHERVVVERQRMLVVDVSRRHAK